MQSRIDTHFNVSIQPHHRFAAKTLLKLGLQGIQQAASVWSILLLIGIVTSTWMAAGTIAAIVFYGIELINPRGFILAAFLLTSFVSFLLGTSFGAAGTIGLALVVMAKGSLVNPHLVAGAIISGAYFGDRCSPMSSSANLVATITQTNLYQNLKNMLRTGLLPFAVSCLIYGVCSWLYPIQLTDNTLQSELNRYFDLSGLVLLPAIAILGLALLRVEVKLSMLISIAIAAVLAMTHQHYSIGQVLQFAIGGFQLDQTTSMQTIMLGGGLISMVKVCLVVLISTAIAGILAGSQALQIVQRLLDSADTRSQLFFGTSIIGIAAAAFGCTQTIGIVLTEQLVRSKYTEFTSSEQLALDLENTVVVLSPLIPWNIAGLVPATLLMTDWRFIPCAVYLYLIPILVFLQLRWKSA